MIVGQHYFDGACAPLPTGQGRLYETFSVGVFQWIWKSGKMDVKRGPVKVRIKGRCDNPEPVYAKAREVVAALDAGMYVGPKTVDLT